MKGPARLWLLLKQTTLEWFSSNAFLLSGALSYFTAFSLAPVLIITLSLAGLFWQERTGDVQSRILQEVEELIGANGASMVETMLDNAQQSGAEGFFGTAFGLGALLFGASVVFVQLKNALNDLWEVEPQGVGVKQYLLNRVLSFGVVLAVGFLLLVSLLLSTALAAAGAVLQGIAPDFYVLIRLLELALSFGVFTVLFAMMYRFLPDVEIAWSDVWIGAGITALLFSLGKFAIGTYLGNTNVASAYGAAGSFVVLLLWVYYSALIFFFGAAFTKVYARHHGTRSGK